MSLSRRAELARTLAIRESGDSRGDKLNEAMRGDLGILTSGAEGDPSSSFSILPISQREIWRAELAQQSRRFFDAPSRFRRPREW
jgi:hypothetical protein